MISKDIFSRMISTSLFGLLLGPVITAQQLEVPRTLHQQSFHPNRALRTTFCRCVADFETFYDRRRQLKSYFLYDGEIPTTVTSSVEERESLRTKTSRYYNEDYTGKTPRQGNGEAVEDSDGFFIVNGITVLPLDNEACIVSQTNSALRTFLELIFRPRKQSRNRSKGEQSFSGLFQNRNRRSLSSDVLNEHGDEKEYYVNDRELQGWGDRRNNNPNKIPSRGGGNRMSLRDKSVTKVLNTDLREQFPGTRPRPPNDPSTFPRVFPCPPAVAVTDAPSAAPSQAIESIFPSASPIGTFEPSMSAPLESDEPTIAQPETLEPTILTVEPSISPVPSFSPSTGIEVSDMPSISPSSRPTFTLAPSQPPSGSPAPTISSVPTNVDTLEPTDSKEPTSSPRPSIAPTNSLSPTSVTQEPSNSNQPSVLPSIFPSVDPTISVFPTISQAPTISPAPNNGATPTVSPNIEPTFSQAPSTSDMPSFVPSFSDRPSATPTFSPSFSPTLTPLPTSPPQLNITNALLRFRPQNSLCNSAMTLPMDGSPMSGTTMFGTNEVDYGCNVTGGIQTSIAPGVWFTAVGNGNIFEVSTCSERTNFGTAIQVLTGGCEDLQCLHNGGRIFDKACSKTDSGEWNRFGTRVRIETLPDEDYSFLVLSRLGANTGIFDIHLEEIATPSNDRCGGAIFLEVDVPKLHIGNTGSASIGTNYGCGSSSLGVNNAAPGIWYVARGNGDVYSASTCTQWTNFDTAIQIFTGSSCDALTCITGSSSDGCSASSGSSTVTFPTVDGETYYIYVFGRQPSDAGTFILTLTSYNPII